MRRSLVAIGLSAALVAATLPYVRDHGTSLAARLSKVAFASGKSKNAARPSPLVGLDLSRIDVRGEVGTAPIGEGKDAKVAELTVSPKLQRAANRYLREGALPEGAVVMTDVRTGKVLAWASYSEDSPARDFATEANAPSASIFKIVTGAGLVERGLSPATRVCYRGGKSRIEAEDLVPDRRRDEWCATIGQAMGRSLNTIFARMAHQHLDEESLTSIAKRLGWGRPTPFDVPVQPSGLELPKEDDVELARAAAGFFHTTMSPFQGASLATTIANGGEQVRLSIVARVLDDKKKVLYEGPTERETLGRAIEERTARAVTAMMEQTVEGGTSFKSFHDRAGRSLLPGIRVAGKTGTLAELKKGGRLVTWWVGFAPADKPEVALSVLAANRHSWRIKATTIASLMLRVYFADQKRPGVVDPTLGGPTWSD
jgi:cell division protein FtsI/penicillin-binding protein 2